jgi:hypothetical protein
MRIRCPKCGTVLTLTPDQAGQIVACSSCSAKLRAPAAKKPDAPPPLPQQPTATPRPADAEFKPATTAPAKRAARPAPPVEPVQPETSSHYDAEPYQPTGRVPVTGALLLAVLLLLAATALGIVGSIVEQHYWLIVLFPLALGLALGGVTAFAVWVSRIDAPWFATLMTIVASLYLGFAFHFSDYVMTVVLGEPPPEVRQMSFLQYMELKAKIGVEFQGSSPPPNQRIATPIRSPVPASTPSGRSRRC